MLRTIEKFALIFLGPCDGVGMGQGVLYLPVLFRPWARPALGWGRWTRSGGSVGEESRRACRNQIMHLGNQEPSAARWVAGHRVIPSSSALCPTGPEVESALGWHLSGRFQAQLFSPDGLSSWGSCGRRHPQNLQLGELPVPRLPADVPARRGSPGQ